MIFFLLIAHKYEHISISTSQCEMFTLTLILLLTMTRDYAKIICNSAKMSAGCGGQACLVWLVVLASARLCRWKMKTWAGEEWDGNGQHERKWNQLHLNDGISATVEFSLYVQNLTEVLKPSQNVQSLLRGTGNNLRDEVLFTYCTIIHLMLLPDTNAKKL